jgi:hypothetical protein
MAFFLLGRSEDGGLSLLSDAAFESRQDALAELGRITADPVFDRWSDEVVLIDIDAGTPVLLVRPAETAVPPTAALDSESEELPEAEQQPEPAVFAAIADEEPDEAPAEEPAAAEPVDENAAAAVEVDGMDSLRDAIARTTEHMEASGIVAPESIGPAEESTDEGYSAQELAGSDPDSVEPPSVPAPEPPAWPWATTPESGAGSDGAPADVVEPPASFVLDGLEDPAVDAGGSLITASIDDEALAANRPVILGAYGEESADEAPTERAVDPATTLEEGADDEEADAPDQGDGIVAATEDVPESDEESDFIVLDQAPEEPETPPVADHADSAPANGLDLDAIEPADAVLAPAPGNADSDGDVPALSSYVCDDCVYVDTCPNKDQRRPEDCGSFQWK